MNRGVITISESGTVTMPTDTVWMTMQEIADMYNVFGCYVRKAVKAIFKDGILKEQIKPDSTYKLLYVALVYMKSSLVAKYNCPQSKKSYEMTITYEELKELTEPWHEYGQEYLSSG